MATILIVDDSAFARHRLQQLLEAGGHEIVGSTAQSEQALELYIELQPDLVTLDHVMDNQPGETALKEIMQHDPQARIIMISGSHDQDLKARALAAGARAFVEKFGTDMNLLEIVQRVMEG